ncbi:MAG: PAS domain-containing protein [Ramlibacter sp.]
MPDRSQPPLDLDRHYRQIVQGAIDDAIIGTEPQGWVVSWNEGARRILGWSAQDMAGRTLHRSFTPEDVAPAWWNARWSRPGAPGLPQPRLIALTGWGQEQDKRMAAQAGFDEHWTSPSIPAACSNWPAAEELAGAAPDRITGSHRSSHARHPSTRGSPADRPDPGNRRGVLVPHLRRQH